MSVCKSSLEECLEGRGAGGPQAGLRATRSRVNVDMRGHVLDYTYNVPF